MMHKYDDSKNASDQQPVKVAVVGSSGYAGLELVRLLQKHPFAYLRVCFTTHPDFQFGDYLPSRSARGIPVVPLSDLDKWKYELNTVFLATPPEVSMEIAPKLLEAGVHVIDLSGAFRLSAGDLEQRNATYEQYYHFKHPAPELLDRSEYGLVPWAPIRDSKETSSLVANPGCYATSVLMALLPLLRRDLLVPDSVVIDAKSGTSGAGRKASQNLLFTEVEGECLPYRIGRHQHLPEIRQFSKTFSNVELDPLFATHLLPVRRGILTSIYAKLRPDVTAQEITTAYSQDYSDYGLVEWGELHGGTDRADNYALSLKRVVGTGLTRIQYQVDSGRLYLFSMIDNLIKGAAGQAIENFNAIQKVPVSTGLKGLEGVL